MCPIKDVSSARRVPRLGIIRLGVKVEKPGKNPYPQATDYFVVPDEIKDIVGDRPKELSIMFPSNDLEDVAPQYLRCYGQTHGLVCWGDGESSRRKVDTHTGDIAGRDTKDWEWREMTCNPEECPEYGARCRRVMNLMFLMPTVPGLGVWQINTTSFYSIREINTVLELIKSLTVRPDYPEGRISFIPVTLALGPINVNPPGMSKKTVYMLHIKTDFRLADIIASAKLPPARLIMPQPEVEEAPEDLFPPEVVEQEPQLVEPPPVSQEKMEEWQRVLKTMGEVHWTAATARSYLATSCDVSVPLSAFESDTPPPQLTLEMLQALRERLEQSKLPLA